MPRWKSKGLILFCLVLTIRHVGKLKESVSHLKAPTDTDLFVILVLKSTNRLIRVLFYSGFHLLNAKIVKENLISPPKIEGMIKLKGEYSNIQLFIQSFYSHI